MADYDVRKAFAAIEEELIASMMRNLSNHRAQETAEGIQWSQWQVEQLAALERYKKRNNKKFNGVFTGINAKIGRVIAVQRAAGRADQEISILQAAKMGAKLGRAVKRASLQGGFHDINNRKLDALIQATTDDMEKAEHAILRRTNDEYRKIIFNAQVYANSGTGTYEKAVDMATRDFLRNGIQCVVYKNGSRHTVSDYADMALRTASKRAYLQGEGEKRKEWGLSTVVIHKRGGACPQCARFCGKVFIDDVWSGGTAADGDYPLLSSAIEAGLYHPRCKDSHSTYFPGLTEADTAWTKEELEQLGRREKLEQRQQYAQRQAERYDRLAKFSLDPENKRKYRARAQKWDAAARKQAEQTAASMGVQADYTNFNPELARAVNQSIAEVRDMFGSLTDLRGVREYRGMREGYALFSRDEGVIYLKNVASPDIIEQMETDAEYQRAMGGWSTGDWRHAIVHEIGHALGKQYLTHDKKAQLEELRRTEVLRVTGRADTDIMEEARNASAPIEKWGKRAKTSLSLYGITSVGEMISESVAQNILSEPGELAQKVILILTG